MKKALKNLLPPFAESFLQFLYPENVACVICGAELDNRETVCKNCFNKLPFIQNPCEKCGCAVFSANLCVRCKSASFYFDKCVSVCAYDNFIKEIVHRFKNGEKYLKKLFAALMAEKLKNSGIAFDIAAAVPVTEKVLKKRGYNQSGLLCEIIAKKLNLPQNGNALKKIKDTDFQKNLSAAKRQKNIEGAFILSDKNPFKNKTVLLIDDVITTGSTLSECAKTLKKGGARVVFCCTFAAVSARISFDTP